MNRASYDIYDIKGEKPLVLNQEINGIKVFDVLQDVTIWGMFPDVDEESDVEYEYEDMIARYQLVECEFLDANDKKTTGLAIWDVETGEWQTEPGWVLDYVVEQEFNLLKQGKQDCLNKRDGLWNSVSNVEDNLKSVSKERE